VIDLSWTNKAMIRLNGILDAIMADDVDVAVQILSEIEGVVELIQEFPQLGKPIESHENNEIRELVIGGTYILLYSWMKNHIYILTIRHFKQEL